MNIIKDAEKLKSKITLTIRQYVTSGAAVHQSVVSSMYHACKHGDPSHLNRIFSSLRPNDQQAVKLWVRRVFIVNGLAGGDPEGMTSAETIEACSRGEVLAFQKGEFLITAGPNTDQAKSLMALCANRFICPDGKKDKAVLDRNNFAEIKVLGDEDILKKIIQAAKAMTSDKNEVHMTPKVAEMVQGFADKAQTTLDQLSLEAA